MELTPDPETTMQPTPEPSPAPDPTRPGGAGAPVLAEPLVEFVRTDRPRAAYVLLGLSALLLALCVWAGVSASRTPAGDDKKKAEDQFKIDTEEPKPVQMNRTEYLVGAVLAFAAFLVPLGAGGWLLVGIPAPDPARQRSQARALILAVGGLLGALLILAAVAYFYLWSSALNDWLDKKEPDRAKYVLGPLLALGVGAAFMFLAVQPARAEERNNSLLRRLTYGSNTGLSVLLLFVALVVFNVAAGLRLPNKLDVTETGFYSLAPGSIDFVQRMPEPVKAYAILPDSRRQDSRRQYEDIKRLLQKVEEVSGGKFSVTVVNPTTNVSEYRTLAGKYPLMEAKDYGVLLTVGSDEKRHAFIPDDEFTRVERGSPMSQQSPTAVFVGESRLMRELLFLSESDQKAVVYFTQSAGELDIGDVPNPNAPSGRLLKEYLTRNYLDVRPLKFEGSTPNVPDDAAVVIVAEPQFTIPEAHAAALKRYMTEPRGGKKGKLIVLAGAQFGPKGEVLPTGLEDTLRGFNVRLDDRFILSDPTRELNPGETAAGFNQSARNAKNPIAMALGDKTAFLGDLWRQVSPLAPTAAPGQENQSFQAITLLITMRGRRSWLEDRLPRQGEMSRIVADVLTNREVARAKQLTDGSRPVGVAVSEGGAGRLVVVGNGYFVADESIEKRTASSLDLVGSSVDWLRDRPPLNFEILDKRYKEFRFPMTADENQGLWLPLLFTLVLIGGLGASVWVVRRQI